MPDKDMAITKWVDTESCPGVGRHGATGGCWCMWWRQTRAEFRRMHSEPNRPAFKAILESGIIPGLLAYVDGEPVEWCAGEPRGSYPALDRSRILARVDEKEVWWVPCFFASPKISGAGA